MQETAIFQRLAQFVTPVFVEIPPCPPHRSGCEHMGVGHKLICQQAFEARAYTMHLTPDCMLSDSSIASLQKLAARGVQLVLAAALRFGEEPFLEKLAEEGVLPSKSRAASGRPLVINGRQMAYAAINGFHSETLGYEWCKPYFAKVPAAAWWRVPAEDGIVIHSLSWAPLLLDYGAVETHDTSTLDAWTIDGDYVHKNIGHSKAIHVVDDSDEMFLASWAPLDERPVDLTVAPSNGALSWFRKIVRLGDVLNSPLYDPMKRTLFSRTVRWHARSINGKWRPVEKRAHRVVSLCVNGPRASGDGSSRSRQLAFSAIKCLALVGNLSLIGPFLREAWHKRKVISYRLRLAFNGDEIARYWAFYCVHRFGKALLGKPILDPPPRIAEHPDVRVRGA